MRDEQTLKAQRFQTTPGVRTGPTYVEASADVLGQNLSGPAISLNLNNFPLPAFINEVFGNRLGLSFSVAPALQAKTDLVSLRLSDPSAAGRPLRHRPLRLADYGVASPSARACLLPAGGQFRQRQPAAAGQRQPGRAHVPPPGVPADTHACGTQRFDAGLAQGHVHWHQPAGQQRPAAQHHHAARPHRTHPPASQAVELFDQPALKGSTAISPVYSDAEALGSALVKVLQAEGYDVSENPPLGGVVVLKLKELQRLIVSPPTRPFSPPHATVGCSTASPRSRWKTACSSTVRNTQAAGIATMLGALGYSATIPATGLNDSNTSSATGERLGSLTGGNTQASRGANSGGSSPTNIEGRPEQGNVVVDANRNAIIYKAAASSGFSCARCWKNSIAPCPR